MDLPFLMPVEDVFSISGRGTVATGRMERGVVKVGEEVEIVGLRPNKKTICTGVEMFRKLLDQGQAGDNVGLLLRGIERDGIERGQVICKPGSVKPHTKFEAEAYILTKEEGGRHTPFFANYRPQFYFRTTDVTGTVELPEGTEMVMPGRQPEVRRRADLADRHGGEAPLRHPRGRPNRRRRRRLENHRVRRYSALTRDEAPAGRPFSVWRRVRPTGQPGEPGPRDGHLPRYWTSRRRLLHLPWRRRSHDSLTDLTEGPATLRHRRHPWTARPADGAARAHRTDLAARPHPRPRLDLPRRLRRPRPRQPRGHRDADRRSRDGRPPADFLLGNHDAYVLAYLERPGLVRPRQPLAARLPWAARRRWPPTAFRRRPDAAARRPMAPSSWPSRAEHLDFLEACALRLRIGGYLFVHAGIRPGVPLEAQDRYDLIWIREPFLSLDRRLRLQGRAWPHHRAAARAPPEPHRHRHRRGANRPALLPAARGRRRRAARARRSAPLAGGAGLGLAGATSGSAAKAANALASPGPATYLIGPHAGP